MMSAANGRGAAWRWWICGLLLLATVINYMDRQTLANAAVRITTEFGLSQEQYGNLEFAFGWAFAGGSLVFGFVADRVNVRTLYPAVLALWSLMAFLTGWVRDYHELLICRALLGFFESAHWPCALKTTQRLLTSEDRTMGNSVLQSGASIGAILTPLIMTWMLAGKTEPGAWRWPFQAVAISGVFWVAAWLWAVKPRDLAPLPEGGAGSAAPAPLAAGPERSGRGLWQIVGDRRFWVLVLMIICINSSWQLVRAWLPKFLQEGRGYSESQALLFNALYFVATDIGCLGAGAVSLWLARRGIRVHAARSWVYLACALLVALVALVSVLPRGWLMLGVWLVVGAGALGVFPCYYSFTQDLSESHMGRVTGLLSTAGWLASGVVQKMFGRLVDQTGSFDIGLALVGLAPLIGYVGLVLVWGKAKPGFD